MYAMISVEISRFHTRHLQQMCVEYLNSNMADIMVPYFLFLESVSEFPLLRTLSLTKIYKLSTDEKFIFKTT